MLLSSLSIIIPALNEQSGIVHLLTVLQPYRQHGANIVLVDGGSTDNTVDLATPLVDGVLHSAKGRALQMNLGAENNPAPYFWFLHADTLPQPEVLEFMQRLQPNDPPFWGRFNVSISGQSKLFLLIAAMMNKRSCLSGIATGDQGLLINADWFRRAGTYPKIPLMEDIALSKALKKLDKPKCFKQTLQTSGRRWSDTGIWKTIALMWWLRLAFFLGVPPAVLATWYR